VGQEQACWVAQERLSTPSTHAPEPSCTVCRQAQLRLSYGPRLINIQTSALCLPRGHLLAHHMRAWPENPVSLSTKTNLSSTKTITFKNQEGLP
jgi:hypothetical protein